MCQKVEFSCVFFLFAGLPTFCLQISLLRGLCTLEYLDNHSRVGVILIF